MNYILNYHQLIHIFNHHDILIKLGEHCDNIEKYAYLLKECKNNEASKYYSQIVLAICSNKHFTLIDMIVVINRLIAKLSLDVDTANLIIKNILDSKNTNVHIINELWSHYYPCEKKKLVDNIKRYLYHTTYRKNKKKTAVISSLLSKLFKSNAIDEPKKYLLNQYDVNTLEFNNMILKHNIHIVKSQLFHKIKCLDGIYNVPIIFIACIPFFHAKFNYKYIDCKMTTLDCNYVILKILILINHQYFVCEKYSITFSLYRRSKYDTNKIIDELNYIYGQKWCKRVSKYASVIVPITLPPSNLVDNNVFDRFREIKRMMDYLCMPNKIFINNCEQLIYKS